MADTGEKPGKNKKETPGFVYSLITFLVSLLVVALIFSVAFYFVLKKDVQGLGERFRPYFQSTPILKHALPSLPETEDPEDPKFFSPEEIKERYNDLRVLRDKLQGDLLDANEKLNLLKENKNTMNQLYLDIESERAANEKLLVKIRDERRAIEEDMAIISDMLAEGDTAGFKDYYEKTDSATAEKLYKQIIKDEKVNIEIKEMADNFSGMAAKKSAPILENIGNDDMELLLKIMDVMQGKSAAAIIENMSTEFASEFMQKRAEKILKGGE